VGAVGFDPMYAPSEYFDSEQNDVDGAQHDKHDRINWFKSSIIFLANLYQSLKDDFDDERILVLSPLRKNNTLSFGPPVTSLCWRPSAPADT
jgi:hypothetical protein